MLLACKFLSPLYIVYLIPCQVNSKQTFFHSVGCLFALSVVTLVSGSFQFDAIPFISSHSYLLSPWSLFRKLLPTATC
jgi:hypothetical protein